MSTKIERLSSRDFEEAMDFLNMVFSMSGKPTNFPKLLPKLYSPTDESMQCNFAIRDNNRIRAVVGLFPMNLRVGDKTFKVGGIGGVSTHPEYRNSGMMELLMKACLEEMRVEGYELSCLSGMRQRYGYYGYEKAGNIIICTMSQANIRHSVKKDAYDGIVFKSMDASSTKWLEYAKKLHDSQLYCFERRIDDFYKVLKSWEAAPWAALDKNGKMVGYIVVSNTGNRIVEIGADCPDTAVSMTGSWVAKTGEEYISVLLPPWDSELVHKLGEVCEGFSIEGCCNWRIFNWTGIISSLLELKMKYTNLSEGEVNIEIINYGVIKISVGKGRAACRLVDEKPDIVCSEMLAARLLFGPLSSQYIMKISEMPGRMLSSWLPLPLCIPIQDEI